MSHKENKKPHQRLSVREKRRNAPAQGPHEGVPKHLQEVLFLLAWEGIGWEWDPQPFAERKILDRERIREMRIDWQDAAGEVPREPDAFRKMLFVDDDFLLDVVNWCLLKPPPRLEYSINLSELNETLSQGGSVYRAMLGVGLVRAVEPETMERAEDIAGTGKPGSQVFREAWREIYGREPNLRHGLGLLVEAVETAAKPWTLPKDERFTLGRLIAAMTKQPKVFEVRVGSKFGDHAVRDFANLLGILWWNQAQLYRHGDPEREGVQPPEDQVSVCLHVAMAALDAFNRGLVRHRAVTVGEEEPEV